MHDRYDEEDEDEKERIGRIFFDERESPRDQYRFGYPNATEPEIKMLLAAEKKNGHPPSSLDHAKIILSDNVWIFLPRRRSPFGRDRAEGEYSPPGRFNGLQRCCRRRNRRRSRRKANFAGTLLIK